MPPRASARTSIRSAAPVAPSPTPADPRVRCGNYGYGTHTPSSRPQGLPTRLYAPGVESTNRVQSLRVEVVGIYSGAIERAAARPSPGVLEPTSAHSFLVGVAKRRVSSLSRHRPPPQCETGAPLSPPALADAGSVATEEPAGPCSTHKGAGRSPKRRQTCRIGAGWKKVSMDRLLRCSMRLWPTPGAACPCSPANQAPRGR